MPSQRRGSQRLSTISQTLVALALLAACTSTTDGQAQNPTYDFQIFLCGRVDTTSTSCHGSASGAQTSALRAELKADTDVVNIRYLSEHDSYLVARHVLASPTNRFVHPGDLPAEFWVDAQDGAVPAAAARYAKSAGVERVVSCRVSRNRCSEDVLRQVGVIH